MTCRLRNRLAMALAVILVVILAGTWSAEAARDKQEVARMTQRMKTVCVGRLLIDFPEETELHLSRARINGFDIEAYPESAEEFKTRLQAREAQLRAIPDRLGGNKNLEVVRDLKTDAGLRGKMFVHGRDVTEGTAANGLKTETYRYENVALEALVHSNGLSIDIVAELYDPDMVENLPRLVDQLVPNPENQIPREPGYCIDRAYVRDPLSPDQLEQVTMFGRITNRPDIEFELVLAAGIEPAEQSLLERSNSVSMLALLDMGRVARLRAAPRSIAGIEGDELARRFIEENDAVVYNFSWEVDGKRDDVFVPHILFMMDTGKSSNGPVPSSLSEGAATGLWDLITSSIRIRPTEVPKKAESAHQVELGTFASAGEVCPQSGWWACSDGGNGTHVLGGQRQYIEKGARMPQALLLPPQTWWEKFRGLQPSYEAKSPTAWKLEDKRSRTRTPPAVQLAAATPATPASTSAAAAFASVGNVAHPPVPLGSYASTGAPCPASGWWRSEEPQAIDGTRWFAQGSLLPPATFVVPVEVFGRTGGSPKAIRRRGSWQLVRHAEIDAFHAEQSAHGVPMNSGGTTSTG